MMKLDEIHSRKAFDEFVLMSDGPTTADGRLLDPEGSREVGLTGLTHGWMQFSAVDVS